MRWDDWLFIHEDSSLDGRALHDGLLRVEVPLRPRVIPAEGVEEPIHLPGAMLAAIESH